MNVTTINNKNLKEIILKKEIILITKKTRKETKVFVSDVWEKQNIIVGMYTNKFGEFAIKQFDMSKYDFCF